MSENMDIYDITPEAQAAAKAAMSGGYREPVDAEGKPLAGVVLKESRGKNQELYRRWSESAVIERTWRESAAEGKLIGFCIEVKGRAGSPNQHSKGWFRHYISFKVLAGQGTPEEKKSYEGMTNRSVNALTSLLQATGLAPKTPGLKAQLLMMLFPAGKDTVGTDKTPLVSKSIVLNLVGQPGKDKEGNTKDAAGNPLRQVQADSYLPDAPKA